MRLSNRGVVLTSKSGSSNKTKRRTKGGSGGLPVVIHDSEQTNDTDAADWRDPRFIATAIIGVVMLTMSLKGR